MIYRLRATIPSSKVFVREYEVPAKISLFDFNKFIINDLCFSSDQIVVYRALDETGAMTAVYGLFDLGYGSMDKVTFEQLAQKGQNVLQFCYDMHNNSCIVITILSEEPEDPRSHYPQTVLEKGHNPDQFSAKYEDPQVYIPRASGSSPVVDDDDEDDEDDDDEEDGKDDDNAFSEFEDGLDSGSED